MSEIVNKVACRDEIVSLTIEIKSTGAVLNIKAAVLSKASTMYAPARNRSDMRYLCSPLLSGSGMVRNTMAIEMHSTIKAVFTNIVALFSIEKIS